MWKFSGMLTCPAKAGEKQIPGVVFVIVIQNCFTRDLYMILIAFLLPRLLIYQQCEGPENAKCSSVGLRTVLEFSVLKHFSFIKIQDPPVIKSYPLFSITLG